MFNKEIHFLNFLDKCIGIMLGEYVKVEKFFHDILS